MQIQCGEADQQHAICQQTECCRLPTECRCLLKDMHFDMQSNACPALQSANYNLEYKYHFAGRLTYDPMTVHNPMWSRYMPDRLHCG